MVKEKEVTPVNIDFNASIHNRFDIEVRDAKTGELKQKAQAFNVICDALWTRLFTPAAYFNCIIYGSGSGTPSASDTTLFTKINAIDCDNQVVYSVNDSGQGNNAVASLRRFIVIDTETSNGTTITEVGIGYDGTHIVTHAMLQDMNGNPISINKTSTDIITIYATLYLHYSRFLYNEGVKLAFEDHLDYNSRYYSYCPQGQELAKVILGIGSLGTNKPILMGNSNIVKASSILPTITYNLASKSVNYSMHCLVSQHNYERGILTMVVADAITIDVPRMFNLRNFDISGEAIGTGDGATTNFNTLFPISDNAKVYVDNNEVSSVITHTGKDREFYKLNKFYDTNHNFITAMDFINYHDVSEYVIENDRNLTFYGATCTLDVGVNPVSIYGSNDFETWSSIVENWVPSAMQTSTYTFSSPNSYRFYRIRCNIGQNGVYDFALLSSSDKDHDIIFSTPPAVGSVITADYTPDCVPKDTDHVFDVSITMTLGEYVGN